jgi:hypothetical protein
MPRIADCTSARSCAGPAKSRNDVTAICPATWNMVSTVTPIITASTVRDVRTAS